MRQAQTLGDGTPSTDGSDAGGAAGIAQATHSDLCANWCAAEVERGCGKQAPSAVGL
jgi:hypothetical protein